MTGQQKMMDHGMTNTPWMLNKSHDDQSHLDIVVLHKNQDAQTHLDASLPHPKVVGHDTEVGPSSKHLSPRKVVKRLMAGVKVAVRVDVPREIRIPPFCMPLDLLDTIGLWQEYDASHLPIHGAYYLHIISFGFLLSDFVVTVWACGPQTGGFQPSCSCEVAWTYDLQMQEVLLVSFQPSCFYEAVWAHDLQAQELLLAGFQLSCFYEAICAHDLQV